MLSTKEGIEMEFHTNKYNQQILKPKNVIEYNKSKIRVDLADQMSSYSSCLRKSIKWFHKLMFELIC